MRQTDPSLLEELMRPDLLQLEEYTPIEPLETLSARLGIPIDQIVKLDANENPYGAAPAALAAMQSYPFYHIYPDAEATALREALATFTGFPASRIMVGSGSDELLELIVRLFVTPGDNIIDLVPTFGMYSFLGKLYQAEIRAVPRHSHDFSINLETTLAAIDECTKIIFVCTPNNPTANTCPQEVIERLLATGKIIVVDEAYYDFAGETFAPLAHQHPNLIVLRTFSKLLGLAGLRVGYGIFSETIIRQLWKIKQPYNVTAVAQIAATAALRDTQWMHESVSQIIAERSRLFTELGKLPGIEPLPSQSNFIFCRVQTANARQIKEELARRGVMIRYFNKPLLQNAFRISVGTPAQSNILLRHLSELL